MHLPGDFLEPFAKCLAVLFQKVIKSLHRVFSAEPLNGVRRFVLNFTLTPCIFSVLAVLSSLSYALSPSMHFSPLLFHFSRNRIIKKRGNFILDGVQMVNQHLPTTAPCEHVGYNLGTHTTQELDSMTLVIPSQLGISHDCRMLRSIVLSPFLLEDQDKLK